MENKKIYVVVDKNGGNTSIIKGLYFKYEEAIVNSRYTLYGNNHYFYNVYEFNEGEPIDNKLGKLGKSSKAKIEFNSKEYTRCQRVLKIDSIM